MSEITPMVSVAAPSKSVIPPKAIVVMLKPFIGNDLLYGIVVSIPQSAEDCNLLLMICYYI